MAGTSTRYCKDWSWRWLWRGFHVGQGTITFCTHKTWESERKQNWIKLILQQLVTILTWYSSDCRVFDGVYLLALWRAHLPLEEHYVCFKNLENAVSFCGRPKTATFVAPRQISNVLLWQDHQQFSRRPSDIEVTWSEYNYPNFLKPAGMESWTSAHTIILSIFCVCFQTWEITRVWPLHTITAYYSTIRTIRTIQHSGHCCLEHCSRDLRGPSWKLSDVKLSEVVKPLKPLVKQLA